MKAGEASNGMVRKEGSASARPVRRTFRGRSTAGTEMYLRPAKEGQSRIYSQPDHPLTPVCSPQDLGEGSRYARPFSVSVQA